MQPEHPAGDDATLRRRRCPRGGNCPTSDIRTACSSPDAGRSGDLPPGVLPPARSRPGTLDPQHRRPPPRRGWGRRTRGLPRRHDRVRTLAWTTQPRCTASSGKKGGAAGCPWIATGASPNPGSVPAAAIRRTRTSGLSVRDQADKRIRIGLLQSGVNQRQVRVHTLLRPDRLHGPSLRVMTSCPSRSSSLAKQCDESGVGSTTGMCITPPPPQPRYFGRYRTVIRDSAPFAERQAMVESRQVARNHEHKRRHRGCAGSPSTSSPRTPVSGTGRDASCRRARADTPPPLLTSSATAPLMGTSYTNYTTAGQDVAPLAYAAGSRWDRVDFNWQVLQPSRTSQLDALRRPGHQRRSATALDVIGILLWTPSWAADTSRCSPGGAGVHPAGAVARSTLPPREQRGDRRDLEVPPKRPVSALGRSGNVGSLRLRDRVSLQRTRCERLKSGTSRICIRGSGEDQ